MSQRTILHADMDAFYAAVEQRDDPALRGRALVIGGLGPRGVVSTASYEARRFGVHSAMPIGRARKLCPDAVYMRPQMEKYAAESARIREIFSRYTPLIEPLSLDEAFMDVSDSRELFGDGRSIAERIRRELREELDLTVSVGVASNKFIAKIASDLDKPDGLVVVESGGEREFLAPLPVSRLWGAGPKTQARLRQLGLATIGDLQRAGEARLVEALGEGQGVHFAALSLGRDERPVEVERAPKSVSHETTFDVDLDDDEEVQRVLCGLAEAVGRRLRRNGLRAGTVRIKLRFPPFRTLTRQRSLEVATDDDLVLLRTARALLDAARSPGQPLRLLGLGGADLSVGAAPRQGGLFEQGSTSEGSDKSHRLLEAMDRIRDRFGDDAIRHGGA